jgi:glucan-binding YG repeat protein
MLKRIFAVVLCLLMVLAALPLAVWAETETPIHQLPTAKEKAEALKEQIQSDYIRALAEAEKESFGGYCGQVASYQMYYRGINSWRFGANGNEYYDIYCNGEKTSGGYTPVAFAAEDYTLEQALNFVSNEGTHDVYNLLACFQTSNTEAGARFGHVVFIYAIIDGIVYFTESFATAMDTVEGEAIAVDIARFAKYYSDWVSYEGLIVMGLPQYMDNCAVYASNLFVQAQEAVPLLTLPAAEGTEGAQLLRVAAAGERLRVTALYENLRGQTYYQIDDGDVVCYAGTQMLKAVAFVDAKVTLTDIQVPDRTGGENQRIAGTLEVEQGKTVTVHVEIADEKNTVVQQFSATVSGSKYNLDNRYLREALQVNKLPAGWYRCSIRGESKSDYIIDGSTATHIGTQTLVEKSFRVGNAPRRLPQQAKPEPVKDGWYYMDDTWYCYRLGQPVTGWTTADGIAYYLQENGAVTTGTTQLEGKTYHFTATGAMRTGWYDTPEGRQFLGEDGQMMVGWQQIGEKYYYFDYQGILQTNCWITVSSTRRYMQPDGSMATGWVELEEGCFGFDINGRLVAQLCEEENRTFIRSCDTITE